MTQAGLRAPLNISGWARTQLCISIPTAHRSVTRQARWGVWRADCTQTAWGHRYPPLIILRHLSFSSYGGKSKHRNALQKEQWSSPSSVHHPSILADFFFAPRSNFQQPKAYTGLCTVNVHCLVTNNIGFQLLSVIGKVLFESTKTLLRIMQH